MNIIIREMKKEEFNDVRILGRKSFRGFESLIVPKPKDALVAVANDKIVGAVLYKFYNVKNIKIGYIDFIFVDPSMHSLGIGKLLFDEVTSLLWKNNCNYISALVKDDNVASWGLLLNKGYKRLSFPQMINELGLLGALNQYFVAPLGFAVGFEYYIIKNNEDIKFSKGNTSTQILGYLIMNTFILSLTPFAREVNFVNSLIGLLIIWIGLIFGGYLGTFFSREDWEYRITDGGFIIHFLVSVTGGIFPFVGNWYPKIYKRDKKFKRALGITALFQWSFLLCLSYFPYLGFESLNFSKTIAIPLSFIFAIPFYPAESYSGARVFKWNKLLYALMLILTIYQVL